MEVTQMPERFTKQLWSDIEPIWHAIQEHPFLKGLVDGSLPEPVFRQYAVQDALYLQAYARSLAAARRLQRHQEPASRGTA
jgi:thiaminase (transcriptional activator TenA)